MYPVCAVDCFMGDCCDICAGHAAGFKCTTSGAVLSQWCLSQRYQFFHDGSFNTASTVIAFSKAQSSCYNSQVDNASETDKCSSSHNCTCMVMQSKAGQSSSHFHDGGLKAGTRHIWAQLSFQCICNVLIVEKEGGGAGMGSGKASCWLGCVQLSMMGCTA